MRKGMVIISITMLIFGLFACGKPDVMKNTDTERIMENTEEMTEAATTGEDIAEGTSATEDISQQTTERPEKETDAAAVDNRENSAADKKTGAASVDSRDSSVPDRETKDNADSSYFGTWKVTAYYMPGVSAMSVEDAESYLGKTCEYRADVFNGDGEVTDAPDYQEAVESAADFFADYRAAFESVGMTGDSVKRIEISNSYGFGCQFFIKDVDTILICQDGVFFEAVRQ